MFHQKRLLLKTALLFLSSDSFCSVPNNFYHSRQTIKNSNINVVKLFEKIKIWRHEIWNGSFLMLWIGWEIFCTGGWMTDCSFLIWKPIPAAIFSGWGHSIWIFNFFGSKSFGFCCILRMIVASFCFSSAMTSFCLVKFSKWYQLSGS